MPSVPTSANSKTDSELLNSTLETMLEVSGEGFLTFGPDFVVDSGTSRISEEFLGLDPTGKPVDLLLWAEENQRDNFLHLLSSVFSGSKEPQAAFDVLECETEVMGRTLQLSYRLLSPKKILVALTDVSAKKQLEELSRAESDRRNLLRKAVSHRRDLGGLTRDMTKLFTQLSENPGGYRTGEKISALALQVHTIRGHASFFEFKKTANAAKTFQQHLADNLSLGGRPQVKSYVLLLKKAYYEELGTITAFLGDKWLKELDSIPVPLDSILKLEAWFQQNQPAEKQWTTLLRSLRTVLFCDLFVRFPDLCQAMARQFGKELHPVTVEGGEFPVLSDQFEDLVSSLVQLVSDMIEGGIEAPAVREAAGKDPRGLLQIRISRENSGLFLGVSDDGKGLDLAGLEARAHAIGLSTVEACVHRLGGSVNAHHRTGQGTSFTVLLPV